MDILNTGFGANDFQVVDLTFYTAILRAAKSVRCWEEANELPTGPVTDIFRSLDTNIKQHLDGERIHFNLAGQGVARRFRLFKLNHATDLAERVHIRTSSLQDADVKLLGVYYRRETGALFKLLKVQNVDENGQITTDFMMSGLNQIRAIPEHNFTTGKLGKSMDEVNVRHMINTVGSMAIISKYLDHFNRHLFSSSQELNRTVLMVESLQKPAPEPVKPEPIIVVNKPSNFGEWA